MMAKTGRWRGLGGWRYCPPWRRQGAGAHVTRQLQAVARARGDTHIVLSSQMAAVPFYLHLGYQPADDKPPYVECGVLHQDMILPLQA